LFSDRYSDSDAFEQSSSDDGDEDEGRRQNAREHGRRRNDEGDRPLYPGAPLTLNQSMLAILSLSISHKLTKACLSDILKLVELHCIEPNLCATSLYRFSKYFENIQSPVVFHYYCSACVNTLESKTAVCEVCGKNNGVQYFLEIPIIEQLKSLFKRPGFTQPLDHVKNRTKKVPDNIEDVYDGELYKAHVRENHSDFHDYCLSLMWYTDGISIFRSSHYEVWPLFVVINEVPFSQRFKKENVILAGLWFGLRKSQPELMLSVYHEDIVNLSNNVEVHVPHQPEPLNIRAHVLLGTGDMPAKSLMLNFKNSNGRFGCHKCKLEGERIFDEESESSDSENEGIDNPEERPRRRRGPGIQIYPFERNLPLRTDEETLVFAWEALEQGHSVYGVKGPSALAYLTKNYVRSTAVDAMHLISNLVKLLNKFWFDSKFSRKPFSLSRHVKLIDQRIKKLTPPGFVERPPRSIVDHGAYWSMSELKMWLFVYVLIVLRDLMRNEFFEHLKHLVMAVRLLHQPSISDEMLYQATSMLQEFVSQFEDLYGRRYMTGTIHSLLHLPEVAKDCGPLFTTSCYPLESLNGILKYSVHGTRFADRQICSAATMYNALTTMEIEKLIPGSTVHTFCEQMSKRSLKLKSFRVSEDTAIVGKVIRMERLPHDVEQALENGNVEGRNFFVFQRVLQNHVLYCSESYNRSMATKSCCVKYELNGRTKIGLIQSFVKVADCHCRRLCDCDGNIYAVVKNCEIFLPFATDAPRVALSFIRQITPVDEISVVNVNFFETLCFPLKIGERQPLFAVEPANLMEKE